MVDGLRPDYVTPEVMPTLVALGQRGVVFTRHHSIYPTVHGAEERATTKTRRLTTTVPVDSRTGHAGTVYGARPVADFGSDRTVSTSSALKVARPTWPPDGKSLLFDRRVADIDAARALAADLAARVAALEALPR
jgi:hypothetical protein